nr:hypothetical protein [Tanacetum cinerariifolium]
MSIDDLYNNLKVYEPEVKGMSSSSSSTQNMAFVPSSNSNSNSTNGSVNIAQVVNTADGVSTSSTQVNAAYTDNLSDTVICSLFASQPSSPQLVHKDLEQIHPDDIEEMDLRWQMAMLIMRARSDQANEGPNNALMAFHLQNEQLLKDLKKSELIVLGYKTGLKSIEERLEFFKMNESVYLEDIKVLKLEIQMKDIAIRELRKKLEIAQKEKDGIQLTVDKLEIASKSLNKLIECQIIDNSKKGLGYENYNAVPPPYTRKFMPPTPELSYTGLDKFVNKHVAETYKAMSSKKEPKITCNFLSDDEDDGAMANMNNFDTTIQVSPTPTTRIHKDHPLDQVIGDLHSATQTRKISKNLEEHGLVSTIQQRTNHKDLQNCLFTCFLSQEEPKKALVDLPNRKRAIGTKWVFRNKKDERGIMIRNKARLVAQGHTQKEDIDYDEIFAPVARIEAIGLFLAYASFKDFVVYQMDLKSAFLYEKIKEEVYMFQRGKIDKTLFIKRYKGDILLVQVYVDDIIFGLTKKELYNAFERLMHENFHMSSMGELTFFLRLQVKQKKDRIFISQDKYVFEILKKFRFIEIKNASIHIETQKSLLKDEDGEEVDGHMYRSMISSLMYLTSSRPDIMFAVCACARYQVNPKVSHLYAVKRFLGS